jgi:methyltransferase (TIGR00027 family)
MGADVRRVGEPHDGPQRLLEGAPRRQASRTAQLMAVQRGLESSRPVRQRLFSDPLANLFVPPVWRVTLAACRLAMVRAAVEATYDMVGGPGPRASAIARTALIDDLVATLSPSVDQVVILGAGYDSRAYRLGCLSSCTVFEVDHPDTQATKRARLGRAITTFTSQVRFVPVDFERDELVQALEDHGYSSRKAALFLWEGVTQYLTPEAVDSTLAAIRQLSSSGSSLVFTYVDSAVVSGDLSRFPEARRWLRGAGKRGEPWIFGLAPAEARTFLQQRGFRLIEDVSTAEAGARYFGPVGRHDHGSGLYRVATTSVI